MADIELFNQSLYGANPTGNQLNDRVAAGRSGGVTYNYTWSAIISWFNVALNFLKPGSNLSELTNKPLALTNIGGLSSTTAASTYATIASQNILANKLGTLQVVLVGECNSNATVETKLFGLGSFNVTRISEGIYDVYHGLNTGALIWVVCALEGGVIGFRSSTYIDGNNQRLKFADDTSANDSAFKVIVYRIEGY